MRRPQDETLAVDSRQAELRPTPASLPFARPAAEGGVGGVPCVAAGEVPVTVDTVTWRTGTTLRLTVILKAAFSVEAGRSTPAKTPPRFFATDVHFRNQPMAHPTAASDRVPWKSRVDVTLLGHAHAPRRRPAPEVALSFTARSGATVLFQRKARALGKRKAAEDAPEPFLTMPVVYERAYGGPSTPTNPIGCGDDEDDAPPNIVDPDNAWRPAALGPLAAGWPLRHRKLRDVPRRQIEAEIMELPPDFDMSYFQSAPAEQQIATLAPGTSFVLEGFHPDHSQVEITTPETRPAGRVFGLSAAAPDAPTALSFQLDTLHIDADNWLYTLVWRAHVELPDEGARERILVAAGVGVGAKEPELPASRPELEAVGAPSSGQAGPGDNHPAAASRRPVASPGRSATGTLDIGSSPGASLPFGVGSSRVDATLALPTTSFATEPSAPITPFAPIMAPSNAPAPPIAAAAPRPAPPAVAAPVALSAPESVPAPAPIPRAAPLASSSGAGPGVGAVASDEGARLKAGPSGPAKTTTPVRSGPRPHPPGVRRRVTTGADVARPEPPAERTNEPYGQVTPWARGAEGGSEALTAGSGAPRKPGARAERKFSLRKGFSRR